MYMRKFKRSIWDKHHPPTPFRLLFRTNQKKRHESLLQSHKSFYLRTSSCNTLRAYCYFISKAFTMFFEGFFLCYLAPPRPSLGH